MLNRYEDIRICVIGLGYVGLPLACLFASRYPTIGFDTQHRRIEELQQGHDSKREVEDDKLQRAMQGNLTFSTEQEALRRCNTYIVAVPTPVDVYNRPDLRPLTSASQSVAQVLKPGDVVIYESTVYPGMTEEHCVPLLEQGSGLTLNQDFFVGYSPERVNPGDKEHTVENIVKVTSGSTEAAAEWIDGLYASVLRCGTYRAPSIRVAEAAKIIENAQRDVNIAFVNELAKIFNAMSIDTNDVLKAAGTKWNFIPMQPGLVGGHCIGVDPYYLIEKAEVYGVMPHVLLNARRTNDGMGEYVAQQLVRCMNKKGIAVKDAKILILGMAFKENCPDIRNTKVVDIVRTLQAYTQRITVWDPWVDEEEAYEKFGIRVTHQPETEAPFDAAVLAVAHRDFAHVDVRALVPQPGVLYDVKGKLPRDIVDARL